MLFRSSFVDQKFFTLRRNTEIFHGDAVLPFFYLYTRYFSILRQLKVEQVRDQYLLILGDGEKIFRWPPMKRHPLVRTSSAI